MKTKCDFWIQKTYNQDGEVIDEREFTINEKLKFIAIVTAYLICASFLIMPFFNT